jgi:hypothetical protein
MARPPSNVKLTVKDEEYHNQEGSDRRDQTHSWKIKLTFMRIPQPPMLHVPMQNIYALDLGNFKVGVAIATADWAKSPMDLWNRDPNLIGHLNDPFILTRSFVNVLSIIPLCTVQ